MGPNVNQYLAMCFAAFTVLILFGFPKAGVYLGNIPFTLSYVLVGMAAVFELVCLAKSSFRKLPMRYAWLGLLVLLLAILELAYFRIYGMKSLGATVSVLVSTVVMPVLAILMTHWLLRILGMDGLIRCLRWAFVPVLFFGLASFLVYNMTGKVLGIPFVTTTGADVASVATRHNLRGPIIKMFSTYNNGNILGINLLLWGPIVAVGSFRSSTAFRFLCVATLSRSVWVGLLLLEVVKAVADRSYRRLIQAAFGMALLFAIVVAASYLIGRDPYSFLLDKDLGGRVSNLQDDLNVISNQRIGWSSESVPAAAWLAFGPAGVLMISAIWAFPIVVGGKQTIQRAARLAMAVYFVVASVEGAFTLVPTQAIYWFLAALALAPEAEVKLSPSVEFGDSVDASSSPIDVKDAEIASQRFPKDHHRPGFALATE
jgi:hypothetical protein